MRGISGLGAVMALMLSAAPALAQAESRAEAGVTVTLVSPAEASALAATRLLFSRTPGVLTIAIPGAGALELTATEVDAATGTFTFVSSAASAAALRALLGSLAANSAGGTPASGLATNGFIAGQGVQVVILSGIQGADGGGTLRATVTFD